MSLVPLFLVLLELAGYQELAKLSCKEPDSKYFRLCGLYSTAPYPGVGRSLDKSKQMSVKNKTL